MDDQQGPTEQHRELCSMLCAAWMGGEFGGEWILVYVWLSPIVHLKLSQRCLHPCNIGYMPIQSKKFFLIF